MTSRTARCVHWGVAGLWTSMVSCAGAAPFDFVSVDLGGGAGFFGQPIEVSGGVFYQHPFGSNYPPTAPVIAAFPAMEYDSYVSLDPLGRSTATYTSPGPNYSLPGFSSTTGHFPMDGATLTGGFTRFPPNLSGFAPSGHDGTMLANLTVTAGATLFSEGIRPFIRDVDFIGGDFTSANFVLDGPSIPTFSGRFFAARSYLISSPTIDGVQWDHYEVWIIEIPTPGTAAILGLSAICAVRRQRR